MVKTESISCVALLLALLLLQVEASSKFSVSFPIIERIGDFNNQNNSPYYKLGNFSANTSIQITFGFPNCKDFWAVAMVYNLFILNRGLKYIDRTGPSPTLQNPIDASTGQPFSYPEPGSMLSFSFTYNVYFPPALGISSAEFVLFIGINTLGNAQSFIYYTLEATFFPNTNSISVQANKQGINILRIVDVLTEDIIKVIYVASPNEVLNFTVFPGNICFPVNIAFCVVSQVSLYHFVLPVSATNIFNYNKISISDEISLVSAQKAASLTDYPGNIAHFSHKFTKTGYYLLKFATPSMNPFITFQSDAYACGYPSDFRDLFSVFQPCTAPQSSNGLPCAAYDANLAVCRQCIQGYTLTNGTCLANTTCPARQYFSFGLCLNVSLLCDAFDAFTGACLSCRDSANFGLANGNCVRKPVSCAPNQWLANSICFNASASCATFDPNTGKCLTCISNLHQLRDGSCTLIVVECPQGQYAVGLSCLTIPAECLSFDKASGKCQYCIKGFFSEDGVCKRVVCPAGQVPSGEGISCKDASPLCEAYSPSGDCLSCKEKGYAVRDGECLQVSALAGCAERQSLGFGPCTGADLNCHIFNLLTGNCDECLSGFFIDFTGHCAQSAKCGTTQSSVNGECLAFPENCLKTDNIGLCTQCVSDRYRLQQGQCVFFQSCQSSQYLNSAGQCVDVSPNCGTFNPSNGLCVTCRDANTQPVRGVCCPTGQLYSPLSAEGCVDASSTSPMGTGQGDGPACAVPHPTLQVCLKCKPGYQPDYTFPLACSPY